MHLEDALHQHFGHRDFRSAQRNVVEAILERRDALVIMPTGGGKSLCYQLPAMLLDGVTVVVSPLIALMKDQVDALQARNIPAAYINSSLSPTEQDVRIGQMIDGHLKLVYIAPERFRHRRFVEGLRAAKVNFFAIDEAHCVSFWGHDFRPDYLRLGEAIRQLGAPPVAAFTATATPAVREDMLTHLNLRDPATFITGFARPNLRFRVTQAAKNAAKFARLSAIVEKHKTGIIYCATRKRVEEVAAELREWDIAHVAYHAGFDETQRSRAQDQFLSGRADVAVATNAFGMGIDRSDIRFVAHFELPGSIEAYYQEAGRAGRDGQPAHCELLFSYRDRQIQEFFIDGANPDSAFIRSLYTELRRCAGSDNEVRASIMELTELMGPGTNGMSVSSALSLLGRLRIIERFDIPGVRTRGTRLADPSLPPERLPLDDAAITEKKQRDIDKLQAVIDFAYDTRCRQQWMLRYFGEADAQPCGCCDICVTHSAKPVRPATDDEKLLVRKALSGVARMSYRQGPSYRGKFGRRRILNMLLGRKSKQITEAGLDQLSTYGLLRLEKEAYLEQLFSTMEQAGLVATERSQQGHPLLTLTSRGEAVMHDREEPVLAWPERAAPPPPSRKADETKRSTATKRAQKAALEAADEDGFDPDPELLEVLRQKRLELARAQGGKPAYVVLSNRSLAALAAVQPLTVEEAKTLPGIGPVKATRVVPTFLRLIAAHRAGRAKS